MKYIFHIHSQINCLISCLIIKQNNINRKDVLFLCFRGVAPPNGLGIIEHIPLSIYYHKFNSVRYVYRLSFLNNKKVISYVDNIINNFLSEDAFTYYVPHCKNPLYSVIINHRFCRQVHYIEDGADNYISIEMLLTKFPNKVHWLHSLLNPFFQLFSSTCADRVVQYENLYKQIGTISSKCFTINDGSFQNELNSNIVKLILDKEVTRVFPTDVKFNNIFVFDALVSQNVITLEVFRGFWRKFISGELLSEKKLSIKFHPAQSEKVISFVLESLKEHNFQYEVLPPTFNFEVFSCINTDKNIYGIGSSILKYSKIKNPQLTFPLYKYLDKKSILDKKRLLSWQSLFSE
ncbi:hypothetical protein [Pseudoalteromonas sp. SR43-2]|uniref:hypothetical protein n=1 Tax=Pseudoalteromonas sp. SR43-2 TaxID=2760944 RepID=UPI0015F86A9B|nr:hypothetical protein [Pseudoalteromonas sp. SR43-2]MBB1380344.1 hypothetical protein [Pseudoalteromonas sp. SR43-2]